MDLRIERLESTTFCGRRLTRRQIADIQETVALSPALSRNELSKTICEHLNWTTPKGRYRVAACLRMLERLEECGVLTLPARRNTIPGPRTSIAHTGRSDPGPAIDRVLAELEPLSLQSATEGRDIADWNELVDRHHGLGCPRPFGPHLRWFVLDRCGRRLGCLLFEAAAKSLPARDAWVGWNEKDRDRRLHLAVSNSRFLIFPWVRVDNLASKALSMAARQLPGEWQQRHGCRPVLCETFVDPTRFDGACYRAANWTVIGMTAGRRSGSRAKPAKQILVLPFDPGFRAVLKGESKTPPRRKPPAPACNDPYVAMWMKIIDAAGELAAAHDRQWMKRKLMTTVSPYARFDVTERVSAWGLAGWGTGAMTIVQDAREATDTQDARDRTVTKADLSMRMGALGARGALLTQDGAGGMDLALKADAMFVTTESEKAAGSAATTADASRLRLVLEGGRSFAVSETATLRPSLELGVRHDGGDAETGAGLELGGGVSYTDAASGLSLEAKARMLVAHADSDYEEWGASATARLDPGERGRGLSLSLAPTIGAASSASERLWGAHDARALAPDGSAFDAARGLTAEAGYGLSMFGDRFTGTPNIGFGMSDGGARDWRIGWRLTSAVEGDPGFEVRLDAIRREATNDNEAEHGVMLRSLVRW